MRGKKAKAKKRQEGETGKRREEGKKMATELLDWLDRWKAGKLAMQDKATSSETLVTGETQLVQDVN